MSNLKKPSIFSLGSIGAALSLVAASTALFAVPAQADLPLPDTISVPAGPTDVAFSPNGQAAFVPSSSLNPSDPSASVASVSAIATASQQVTSTVNLGGAPTFVAVAPDGNTIYVANTAGYISVVSVTYNNASDIELAVLENLEPKVLGVSPSWYGISTSTSGQYLYVSGQFPSDYPGIKAQTFAIDLTTDTLTPILGNELGDSWTNSYNAASNGTLAMVTLNDPAIDIATGVNDPANPSFSSIDLTGILGGTPYPWGAAVTDSEVLVTAEESGNGYLVNGNNSVVVGDLPRDVAATPNSDLAITANSAGDSISVVNTNTMQLAQTVDLGSGTEPVAVAISPTATASQALAYTANNGTNTVSILQIEIPATPTNVLPQLTAVQGCTQFSFDQPAQPNNLLSITGYEYQLSIGGVAGEWTAVSPPLTSSPVQVCGLVDGTEYQVSLRAVNAMGASAGSTPITYTGGTYGPASDLVVTPVSETELSVAFTPPLNMPGKPVTNYQVSLAPNADNTAPYAYTVLDPAQATSPISITGLLSGLTYTISLQPINAVGVGYPSQQVRGTTLSVPGNPRIRQVTGQIESAVVYFTPPENDGGAPISNYEYAVETTQGQVIYDWTPASPAQTTSPLIIRGLSPNTTYNVSLRAVNEFGPGAPTGKFGFVTTGRPRPIDPVSVNAEPAATIDDTSFEDDNFAYGIATDLQGDIYQLAVVAGSSQKAIVEYPAGGSSSQPLRTISGSNTGLQGAVDIAVGLDGSIYVANRDSVQVFDADANGNVAPSASFNIAGNDVDFQSIAVDNSGVVYLTTTSTQTVYTAPGDSSGTVSPTAAIVGANTGLTSPIDIQVSLSGEIVVLDSVPNSMGEPSAPPTLVAFAPGTTGNVAPVWQIQSTAPVAQQAYAVALDLNGNPFISSWSAGAQSNSLVAGYCRPGSDVLNLGAGYFAVQCPATLGESTNSPAVELQGDATELLYPSGIAFDQQQQLWVSSQNTVVLQGYDFRPAGPLGQPEAAAQSDSAQAAASPGGILPPGAKSEFYSLPTPQRLYDSRPQVISAGQPVTLDTTSVGVPDDATAISYNITVTNATGSGFVRVGPGGTQLPTSSVINYGDTDPTVCELGSYCPGAAAPATVANGYYSALGAGGTLQFDVGGASAAVIIDVTGYFRANLTAPESEVNATNGTSPGAVFVPVTPVRAYDSRDAGAGGSLASGAARVVPVGAGGVVPANAIGIAYTLTATGTTNTGWLAVTAADVDTAPGTSTLNWFNSGQTFANSTVTGVSDRSIRVFAGGGGSSQVVVDVTGYLVPAAAAPTGLRFAPITPARSFDSRTLAGPISGGQSRTSGIVGANQMMPLATKAAAYNLTIAETVGAGYLTTTPGGSTSAPWASTINWFTNGQILANGTMSGMGAKSITTFAGGVSTEYLTDTGGYFY